MKLGKRLSKIESMVSFQKYDHIWDCCCDHGLLGFKLLLAEKANIVHFVDVVPGLIKTVEQGLLTHYKGDNADWQVHCLDVACLPLAKYEKGKQLIIIAGVGGELMIELLRGLLDSGVSENSEFLLSPVHHNYQVREMLIENGFSLVEEKLVFENKRGYEILHLSLDGVERLSTVGSSMWDFNKPQHSAYLNKKIAHCQRALQSVNCEEELKAYMALNS